MSALYTVVATVVDPGSAPNSRVMVQIPIFFLRADDPDAAIRKANDVLSAPGRLSISVSVYDHGKDDPASYRATIFEPQRA